MIMDFTGIGILAGLLLTVFGLLIFVIFAFAFAHAQKSRNDKPLAEQSAFRFLLVASIFLLINICFYPFRRKPSRGRAIWGFRLTARPGNSMPSRTSKASRSATRL